MEFNEYQKESRKTVIYINAGNNLMYPALGLAGEVGETIERVKRIARHHSSISITDVDPKSREEISSELGDVLWYLAQFATELNVSLDEIAQANLKKLRNRQKEGTLD